jgi:hypothetical protein
VELQALLNQGIALCLQHRLNLSARAHLIRERNVIRFLNNPNTNEEYKTATQQQFEK